MQILFVHPNYPAQFGPVLTRLARDPGVECVFVTKRESLGARHDDGVRKILYRPRGGAAKSTHFCSRTFENAVWQSHAIYEACKSEAGLSPDVIVGHSGFGTTAMLKDLYDAPVLNLFEYFYHSRNSDLDFRPDFPPSELERLRSRMRNAMILIDLEACDAGYAPTHWQRSLLPEVYQSKVSVIHDGIDTRFWTPRRVPRRLGDEAIPPGTRIVTYVTRGFESMRGFDIFIKVANRIAARLPDVLFVCVGSDRISYGSDLRHVRASSFREHVLAVEKPDLARFRFTGALDRSHVADLLSISDLHVYLTVPFVLSWSMLEAMACECLVLASDTPPVREVIRHRENGLLGGFFDVEGLADQAVAALEDPSSFADLRSSARRTIESAYALDLTHGALRGLIERTARPATRR